MHALIGVACRSICFPGPILSRHKGEVLGTRLDLGTNFSQWLPSITLHCSSSKETVLNLNNAFHHLTYYGNMGTESVHYDFKFCKSPGTAPRTRSQVPFTFHPLTGIFSWAVELKFIIPVTLWTPCSEEQYFSCTQLYNRRATWTGAVLTTLFTCGESFVCQSIKVSNRFFFSL